MTDRCYFQYSEYSFPRAACQYLQEHLWNFNSCFKSIQLAAALFDTGTAEQIIGKKLGLAGSYQVFLTDHLNKSCWLC